MNDYFASTVFFTLFFIVDPLGLLPVFLTYLTGLKTRKRISIIIKTISISIAVSLFFILFGKYLLKYLAISTGSFLVAGGVLLFVIAMEMLLGSPSKIKMRDYQRENEPDISVFPLAIPMLCGPGNIAALLMFSAQAENDPSKLILLIILMISVFLITLVVMLFTIPLGKLLGNMGVSIIQRMVGLILSALAIQFIKNGLVSLKIVSQ